MRLRRGVAILASVALAGAVLVTVTGNGRSSAEDVATPSAEPAPYMRSVHMAYTVRPDHLLDYEATVEYRIGTQAAAEALAQQRIGVNEHFDDLQIVEAATLKADGRRLDVPPGKIMKKSSSDNGKVLFDADKTIRIIIFPHVSPGDSIRYVVRYRAKKAWLPGGFEIDRTASPWRRYSDLVISLNAPVGMKLLIDAKGFVHSEEHRSGRTIHEWTLAPLPYRPAEPAAVAVADHGPYLRISSFADLQMAGAAFCGRAEPTSASTPVIARFANQITEDMSSRREQARAIFDWVASNIRYVLISLGTGGMVPHPAESILQNRYGDCKDYATLMRALLAAKGIKSEYALINTAPVYKAYAIPFVSYDHVILHLPEFDLYVDPTATHSTFEQLPYYLADKPALRCGCGKSALARVPPSSPSANTLTVTANLTIDGDGKAKGETILTGTGAAALRLRSFMESIERSGSEAVLRPLFDALNVGGTARIERRSSRDRSEPYSFKITYSIADSFLGAQNSMELIAGPIPVTAPQVALKPIVRAGRIDDFKCHPRIYREDITYSLPAGWTARLPDDVSTTAGPVEFTARYSRRGQAIEAHRSFAVGTPRSVCPASLAGIIAPAVKAALHDAGERLTILPETLAPAGR